ncbi:MAG: FHA domain-containing protein [Candidatus Dactylopiibacterium sp.]|nr:FHA domain-containing protein [Candidatus Dactylopiibacterium sp.]
MTDPQKSETCVLVAEITGDAPLLGKIGAMETQRAVERCRNRAERALGAYLGDTIQADGRTLIAHFPRAENAMLAAIDLRARVKQLPPVSGVALSAHAAIHAGRLDSTRQPVETALAATRDLLVRTPAGEIHVSASAAALLPASVRATLEARPGVGFDEDVFALRSAVAAQAVAGDAGLVTNTNLPTASLDALEDLPEAPPSAETAPVRTAMLLRHDRSTLLVSAARPILLAGREDGNDIVIADRRASRHHARIEWRQGRFVLVDTSTNGSFIVDDAGNETALRRAETELPARGRIGFGYSPAEVDAECVLFDIASS